MGAVLVKVVFGCSQAGSLLAWGRSAAKEGPTRLHPCTVGVGTGLFCAGLWWEGAVGCHCAPHQDGMAGSALALDEAL